MAKLITPRPYDPAAYERLNDPIQIWDEIALHQAPKDQVLIPALARHFVSGRLLELGAATGHLSQMLKSMGWQVISSDFQPFFVEHLRKKGLDACRVDATDIAASGLTGLDNIFSHSITPFITHDYDVVARTYRSTLAALRPGGRMVMVHAMEKWRDVGREMRRHRELALGAGYRHVRVFRNQLLPSAAYRAPFTPAARVAEQVFGPALGNRFVLVGSRRG